MNEKETIQQEIISIAKNTKHYCDLLIAQSECWEKVEKEESKKELNINH